MKALLTSFSLLLPVVLSLDYILKSPGGLLKHHGERGRTPDQLNRTVWR